MYKIIALIGEAGSGKDRIMKEVLAAAPTAFNEIISCTTRPPREGEQEGVNYYFLTNDEFIIDVLSNKMLEHTNFNGWNYGTSKDALKEDKINIGVFNPAGIYALKQKENIDLEVYRVVVGDKERMLRQLNRETNPNVDEIVRRYDTDKIDFNRLDFTYYLLDNQTEEDLQKAVDYLVTRGRVD